MHVTGCGFGKSYLCFLQPTNQPTNKQTRRVSSRLKCFFCAFQCSWRNMWHSIMPLWSYWISYSLFWLISHALFSTLVANILRSGRIDAPGLWDVEGWAPQLEDHKLHWEAMVISDDIYITWWQMMYKTLIFSFLL